MSLTITEGREQVELEPGHVDNRQVKGQWVELRVLPLGEDRKTSLVNDSDVMLDSWVELPRPTPLLSVVGEFGPLPPSHIREIPRDEDEL
jgi:hypothetical protein